MNFLENSPVFFSETFLFSSWKLIFRNEKANCLGWRAKNWSAEIPIISIIHGRNISISFLNYLSHFYRVSINNPSIKNTVCWKSLLFKSRLRTFAAKIKMRNPSISSSSLDDTALVEWFYLFGIIYWLLVWFQKCLNIFEEL